MGRRKLVVLLSAVTMLLIGAAIVGSLVIATQSVGGRDWIRRQLVREIARGVHGKLFVGRLSGSLLTDFMIDSVRIAEADDSVFAAAGQLHVTFDPRDIIDGRIIVRSLELQHPYVVMRRELDDTWNYKKIFPPSGSESPPPSRNAFGATVIFRNVRIRGLDFNLTQPWVPDDSLRGAHRDSAIVRNLADPGQLIRAVVYHGKRGYEKTVRWNEGNITLTRLRFRQPLRTGKQFDLARFDINENSPPFHVRNMQGGVLWRNDSIWVDIRHLELPNSVARATGRIDWGDNRSPHVDLRIHSDSVGLADVAWITPNFPKTGGGAVDLHIKTERDGRVTDYTLANMDIRTDASRLRGAMTFGVGGPVLAVKDLNVDLEPFDFAFIETLSGGPLTQPWHGAFTGTVRGRGGPLNHLAIAEARLTYNDRNVPGAVSSFVGKGEVDMLAPANTRFNGFQVTVSRFDLRTPQFLSPGFPRLNGIVSGVATLDSVWTDVRFRDADITIRDGDSTPPNHFKGDARLTTGADNVSFDVAVAALPLSFTTLARSYPGLPLRGEYTGPIRVQGDVTDFTASTDLTGDAGRLQLEGQFDMSSPGYRAVSHGSVTNLDIAGALGRPASPATTLNLRFATSVTWDSLPDVTGTAELFVDRSIVDSVRVYGGDAALRFVAGTARLDTLHLETSAGSVAAHGALGLSTARTDSIQFRADLDSLGGLRRYLVKARPPRDSAARATAPADTGATALADSLAGAFVVNGTVAGSIPLFSLHAKADGSSIRVGAVTARTASLSTSLASLPDSARGSITFELDTLRAGRLAYSRITVRDSLSARAHQHVTLSAKSALDSARVMAALDFQGDTTRIRVDSLTLQTTTDQWTLRRRATVDIVNGSLAVDSLFLTGRNNGVFALSGKTTADSAVAFSIRSDSVPLADISELAQAATPFEGTLSLDADVRGTRESPLLHFDGTLRHGLMMGLRLDELHAGGDYANRKLATTVVYSRLGTPAMHGTATLPIDLALDAAGPRLVEAPLVASIHTDSGGMAVLATLSKAVTKASGALALDVEVSGTWEHPLLNGALVIHNGELSVEPLGNVKLNAVEANLAFRGDSVAGKITAHSGKTKPATGELSGSIGFRDFSNPTFNLALTTQGFNVIDRARFATLDLTGHLALTGSINAATLGGALTVDAGVIAIPELFSKHLISLDDPEFYRIVDTSAFEDRRLLPTPPSAIMNNLVVNNVTVQMGKEVWLRSNEANINLGGRVTITSGRSQKGTNAGRVQFALDGALQTVRGTYKLNLGPVARTFTVESGDVRFFGDPDLNGVLNINAQYVVRQTSQQGARPDVRVEVHLGGTLAAPTVDLSSPDSQRVSQADLLSYLATGQPSNQIGGATGDYTSTLVNGLTSYVGSQFGASATGGLCDDAQLTTAATDAYQGAQRTLGSGILAGTSLNCARQLSDRVFLRLDYGLCRVGQLIGGGSGPSDPLGFADAIGVKLDYEINNTLTLSGGMEPPTAAVLCAGDATARGFVPTPRQFGIDLLRLWRF